MSLDDLVMIGGSMLPLLVALIICLYAILKRCERDWGVIRVYAGVCIFVGAFVVFDVSLPIKVFQFSALTTGLLMMFFIYSKK